MDLTSAVDTHDTLLHPFYQAWTRGELTLEDLSAYAAQYAHQVDALPALIRAAREASSDPATRAALQRSLDEEEGRAGRAHAELWSRFRHALGQPVVVEAPEPETREAGHALRSLVGEGEVEALAALWAYERQTARVARTKREGLTERYGVHDPQALAFFTLHEELDVVHASDLLAALERACAGDAGRVERARDAAVRSACAQWRFLDGAERRRPLQPSLTQI